METQRSVNTLEKAKLDMINAIREGPSAMVSLDDSAGFLQARRIIVALARKRDEEIPYYLKNCRNINEALSILAESHMGDWNSLEATIINDFNEYIFFIEDQSIEVQIIHVECEIPPIDKLSFSYLFEAIQICDARIESGDFSGAVTSAQTILQTTFLELLTKLNGTVTEEQRKAKLPALYKAVKKNLNLEVTKITNYEQPLKEIISGINKIVVGINQIRNIAGDGHTPKYRIDKHHAVLVVNSVKTVVTFLFNTFEFQQEKIEIKN